MSVIRTAIAHQIAPRTSPWRCTCTALPSRLPSATAAPPSGASTTTSALAFDDHLDQRLAAELRAVGLQQLLGDLAHVGAAAAALVARQQQQRAWSGRCTAARRARCAQALRASCRRVRDCASSSSAAPRITASGVRSSWLTSALNSRSRWTRLVMRAGIVVQRRGQLADFVVGEMRRQLVRVAAAARQPADPPASSDSGLITRDDAHHADQPRQAGEQRAPRRPARYSICRSVSASCV